MKFEEHYKLYCDNYSGRLLYFEFLTLYKGERVCVLRDPEGWSIELKPKGSRFGLITLSGPDITFSEVILALSNLDIDLADAHEQIYNSLLLMAIVAEMENDKELLALILENVEEDHFQKQKVAWEEFGKSLVKSIDSVLT